MKNKKNNENKELTEQLQRLQAEFENYKKRTEREQEQIKDYTKAQLLLKLLNIHDDFERTLTTQATQEQLQTGIELIHKQLVKLLAEEQVTPIQSKGQKLDPYKHEVLIQENGEEDIITEELQKGYLHKDKILRPARVKISRKEE
ncbi:MAG: nucleotide exchange factor GrpE [archaeon]